MKIEWAVNIDNDAVIHWSLENSLSGITLKYVRDGNTLYDTMHFSSIDKLLEWVKFIESLRIHYLINGVTYDTFFFDKVYEYNINDNGCISALDEERRPTFSVVKLEIDPLFSAIDKFTKEQI